MSMRLEIMILKTISSKEMYGYEIVSELRKLSNDYFSMKTGTAYPLLQKMVKNNLLFSHQTNCKQNRTYYKITDCGFEYLQQEIQNWKKYSKAVNKVLGI